MRWIVVVLVSMWAVAARAADIEVSDPFARQSQPGAPSGAIFMVLTNKGATSDRLLMATTPVAEIVQLHAHIDDGGVMRMRQIEGGILLEPGASRSLERGGDHVMLMGVTERLKDGDIIQLTLVFENAGEITVDVPIDNARGAPKP